jgi:hypothetical protein
MYSIGSNTPIVITRAGSYNRIFILADPAIDATPSR